MTRWSARANATRLGLAFQLTWPQAPSLKSEGSPHMMSKPLDEVDTLGAALPREMARIRDEVLPAYREVGVAGAFAVMWMTAALNDAFIELRDRLMSNAEVAP